MVTIIMWGLGVDTSAETVGRMYVGSILLSLAMTGQGWFCGALSSNEQICQLANLMFTLLWMLTSGGLGQASTIPAYISWLQVVSPLRYGFQIFVSCLVQQIPDEPVALRTQAIHQLGMDQWPLERCFYVLAAESVAFCFAGWFMLEIRTRCSS